MLDLIMPGESRMRGVMLYELHLPNVMLGNRWCMDDDNGGYVDGELPPRMLQAGPGSGADPKEIKKRLRTGLDCLKKGLAILQVC